MWQALLDIAGCLDKVHRIVVMLFDTGRDCENIGVENNIFRWEVDFLRQHFIAASTDLAFALTGVSLAVLIKRHHDNGGAITTHQSCLLDKLVFTFLETDRVDDTFALNTFQAGFNDFPLG